ncbi:MAG: hypothetical protein ABIQ18_18015 [Umezawaea sp.]
MAGKYGPLNERLAALAEAGSEVVEFDFADIADLVGGLPPSAFKYREWWANDSKVEAQAWRDADWHVAVVSLERKRVRFERGAKGGSYLLRGRRPAKEKVVAAFAVETYLAHMDVRVNATWERAGDIVLDAAGGLVFPTLPNSPGAYRISMVGAEGQDRMSVYVGEAVDLQRRAYNYRNPGPTQTTSQRIHDHLITHLSAGGSAVIAVTTSAMVEALGESTNLPLDRKTARVLVENAALALIYLDGSAVVMNKDKGAE